MARVLMDIQTWTFIIVARVTIFGTVGMLLNFVVALVVVKFSKQQPEEIQELVETIRIQRDMLKKD